MSGELLNEVVSTNNFKQIRMTFEVCSKVGSFIGNVKSEIFMSRWPVGRFARRTGLLGLSNGFHRKQRYSQLLLSSNKPMICLEDGNYDRYMKDNQ